MTAVEGADGRSWTVKRNICWYHPATEDQFEHDTATGYVAGIVMLVVVVALVLFVLLWTPDGVFLVSWLVLLFPLILLLLLMQWTLRRPWTIVAKTLPEPTGTTAEHWVGTAKGMVAAWQEKRQVIQNLRSSKAVPDDGSGLLQEVK